MSPGPNTIRKVSRLRAHLDFTTRPRTGNTSVSTPDAGSITNLLFIDTPPLRPCVQTSRASWLAPAKHWSRAGKNIRLDVEEGRISRSRELERWTSALRIH